MKLQYIANGAQDTPLIRIYEFDAVQAHLLRKAVTALAAGTSNELRLHTLDGVESVGGCRLTCAVDKRDIGVTDDGGGYRCVLTRESWAQVAGLIEPFCDYAQPGTFQYLDQTSNITLVLTVDGGW